MVHSYSLRQTSLRTNAAGNPQTHPSHNVDNHTQVLTQATPVAAIPTRVVHAPAIAQSRPRYFGTNLSNSNVAGPAPTTSRDKPVAAAPTAASASNHSALPLPQDSVTPTASPNASLAAAAAARFAAATNATYVPEPLPRKQRRRGLQQHPRNPTRKQLKPCPPPAEPRPRDPPSHYLCGGPAPEYEDEFVDAYEDPVEDVDEEMHEDGDADADEELYEDAVEYQESSNPVRDSHFACGSPSCLACTVNHPPLGHKNPITHTFVASFLRHAIPDKFETPEQVRKREAPTVEDINPPKENPEAPEGGDLVYSERGSHEPPKGNSGKAVPTKSCLSKKNRYHPYGRPAVYWSYRAVKTSLAEALLNRHDQNYEGPKAIAIHDEMSHIDVPGTGPSFKWEPAYTGPPSAFPDELEEAESSPPVSAVSSAGFLADDELRKEEVAERRFPTNGKKRRFEEEEANDITDSASSNDRPAEGSAIKKLRRVLHQIQKENPGFANESPSFEFTFTPPKSLPSTSRSSSTTTTEPCTPSETEAARKPPFARRKTRVNFKADPTTLHPKYGVTDSLYLHHSRLPSKSLHSSKAKKIVHRSGPDWYSKQLEEAQKMKARWIAERRDKLDNLTSFTKIEERIKKQGKNDGEWERWGDAVDRYEAAYPWINLADVRARYLRPAKKEERGVLNKEYTKPVGESEPMRNWYPAWEHPAWDGVDEEAKREWMESDHYQVTHREVTRAMVLEEHRRTDRRREMEMAARMEGGEDGDTEVDETEDAMRREFLEEGREGDAMPQAALQAPPPPEPIHPGLMLTPVLEAFWEAMWSAPDAHPPIRL